VYPIAALSSTTPQNRSFDKYAKEEDTNTILKSIRYGQKRKTNRDRIRKTQATAVTARRRDGYMDNCSSYPRFFYLELLFEYEVSQ
jgi:hypothetical protein